MLTSNNVGSELTISGLPEDVSIEVINSITSAFGVVVHASVERARGAGGGTANTARVVFLRR